MHGSTSNYDSSIAKDSILGADFDFRDRFAVSIFISNCEMFVSQTPFYVNFSIMLSDTNCVTFHPSSLTLHRLKGDLVTYDGGFYKCYRATKFLHRETD